MKFMRFNQHPTIPHKTYPIYIVGAGAIMRNAHLPAYKLCGFTVKGVTDTNLEAAQSLANDFEIPLVTLGLSELVRNAEHPCVFDLAVPASAVAECLELLPDGAAVLIQKPLGETLEQAKTILSICEKKNLKAAVNFQLRYAPYSLALQDALNQGLLGEILEVDVKVRVHTPWALWSFLEKSPRMEIVYHSIHYLDFIRCLLGNPHGVKANTIKHPASPKLHSSRSAIILDYGPNCRAEVVTYHAHNYGPKHQQSEIMIEGTKGAACFQMGLNMNYPQGYEDFLHINLGDSWQEIPLEGSWFPHAFRGTMASMMHWLEDESKIPSTNVHDAFQTMALVEAAYQNAESPGTSLESFLNP